MSCVVPRGPGGIWQVDIPSTEDCGVNVGTRGIKKHLRIRCTPSLDPQAGLTINHSSLVPRPSEGSGHETTTTPA